MPTLRLAAIAALAIFTAGCSTTGSSSNGSVSGSPSAATSAPSGKARIVKSRDGSYTGEIVGQPAANSKFAKLEIGMSMSDVQSVLGRGPDQQHTYESGKRWIPFYFGNDARRMQVLFNGEGCLIFTGGNIWGGAGGDLIQIEADPSGACYQP